MLVFEERGKPEYPEKNLSEQSREPTNSVHIWRRVRESNPGHIGGGRALSRLRQPCSPWLFMSWTKQYLSFVLSLVPSSDPGSSDESTDGSLSDYEPSNDLSSEGECEEDDLYQPLSFRLVNVPLMKTHRTCTYKCNLGIDVKSGSEMRVGKRSLKLTEKYFGSQRCDCPYTATIW